MKFSCECGHTIHDNTDFLSYKAELTADQDRDDLYDGIDSCLKELIAECEKSASTATSVTDRIDRTSWKILQVLSKYGSRSMYQCSQCGSLYIDDIGGGFHRFAPANPDTPRNLLRSVEGDRWRGMLRGHWNETKASDLRGSLWWFQSDKESGYEHFENWEVLQCRYHEVLTRLQTNGILRDAFLNRNGETVHEWPAKP